MSLLEISYLKQNLNHFCFTAHSYKKLELAFEGIAAEHTGYQTKTGTVDINAFPAGRTPRRPLLLQADPG